MTDIGIVLILAFLIGMQVFLISALGDVNKRLDQLDGDLRNYRRDILDMMHEKFNTLQRAVKS